MLAYRVCRLSRERFITTDKPYNVRNPIKDFATLPIYHTPSDKMERSWWGQEEGAATVGLAGGVEDGPHRKLAFKNARSSAVDPSCPLKVLAPHS